MINYLDGLLVVSHGVDGVQNVVGVVGLLAEHQLLVADPQLGALVVAHNQVLRFGHVQLDLWRLRRSCVVVTRKNLNKELLLIFLQLILPEKVFQLALLEVFHQHPSHGYLSLTGRPFRPNVADV